MKKILSVIMVLVMVVAMTGCFYAEDHFTLNADGSGNVYSYILIEKEAYDSMMGMADSMTEEEDLVSDTGAEMPVVTIDGIEYYEMEESQDFASVEELEEYLVASYDDVRVSIDTISFDVTMDEEETEVMTYEDMVETYAAIGIDIETAVEGYMVFNMPAPIVSTTGELSEDGCSATYFMNMKTMYDGMDIFVTTSEEEAANEKIRNGVENTKITVKSSLTSKGKIKLTWKKSSNYKMDYYEVFRSTKKNSGYGTKAYYRTSSGKKTSYINSKVKSGTRYYYKVRGVRVVDGEKIYTEYSNKANRKAR